MNDSLIYRSGRFDRKDGEKKEKIDFKKSVKRIQESHGFNCLCSKVKDERESLPDTNAHLT